jgi:hypothetical protein
MHNSKRIYPLDSSIIKAVLKVGNTSIDVNLKEINLSKIWPVVILMANRKESVTGRIRLDIISIKTNTGAKAKGEPLGTRCANTLLYL